MIFRTSKDLAVLNITRKSILTTPFYHFTYLLISFADNSNAERVCHHGLVACYIKKQKQTGCGVSVY